ncbi:PIN domain-containing protein [Chelatococcus asaccharovorans]|jgi:predicted nucleic acid-binding protein|uniref:PIN domain-containing protein n=1 Tax=Chelatococcus asaccharovorans TaxID=28210 RepID=UPI00224C6570|nr:PIN domain-containing protein [Chelatococcus asaccharovorans]CAH1667124.1 Ribonuclease VapC [Chelatococcus asaccharovorans]CAH1681139.1 Ribonuclease VapC [Chelatococcus asaccharovorans]HMR30087.1 PIN domain-containing protein [Geminicoccus sp.]HMU50505.1 PIN domain-containing protein [Geminicoccaceae bacterium]
MRYLLDTSIIGNATGPSPSQSLLAWLADQDDDDLYITSLTVAEIRRGILETPAGKQRNDLGDWLSGPEGPQTLFAGRILPFDEAAALIWARMMADAKASGQPSSALATIIAAVAEANGCIVVTDNPKGFPDVEVINPMREG